MEEILNEILLEKIFEINELEITKMKILTAIFIKTKNKILEDKINSLKINLKQQAEFYNQDIENYDEEISEIVLKYKEQLYQVTEKYNELFINMQLELQEAECNQKIAITNLKNISDVEKKIESKATDELINQYRQNMQACLEKKNNYDVIIDECEKELDACADDMNKIINRLFVNKSNQIAIKNEKSFKQLLNKIINKFTGKKRFNEYVIEPMYIELEMTENKLPDVINNIKEETIDFVAKIKNAKTEINKIFENNFKS